MFLADGGGGAWCARGGSAAITQCGFASCPPRNTPLPPFPPSHASARPLRSQSLSLSFLKNKGQPLGISVLLSSYLPCASTNVGAKLGRRCVRTDGDQNEDANPRKEEGERESEKKNEKKKDSRRERARSSNDADEKERTNPLYQWPFALAFFRFVFGFYFSLDPARRFASSFTPTYLWSHTPPAT